jgi:Rieske Fe-S protein
LKPFIPYKTLLTLLLLSLFLFACKRNKLCDFPYVYVNLTLGIFSDLGNTGPGQTFFINNQGLNNNGIIIYKTDTPDDFGNFRFFAFDRTCTHEPDHSCAVDTVLSFNGFVECPCCKSQYMLMFEGDVFKGPAVCPMIQYNSIISGDRLIIRN